MPPIPVYLSLKNESQRGLNVVKHRIKGFAQEKVTLHPGRHKLNLLDDEDW